MEHRRFIANCGGVWGDVMRWAGLKKETKKRWDDMGWDGMERQARQGTDV